MNRRRVQLAVEDIFIPDGKAAYIAKRGVLREHVAEVLSGLPHFYVRPGAKSGRDEFSMLGRSDSGRFLLAAIEQIERPHWRLITAYWMREAEAVRMYEGGQENAKE